MPLDKEVTDGVISHLEEAGFRCAEDSTYVVADLIRAYILGGMLDMKNTITTLESEVQEYRDAIGYLDKQLA